MKAAIVILLLILVVHFTGPLVLYLAAGAVALYFLFWVGFFLMFGTAMLMQSASRLIDRVLEGVVRLWGVVRP